MLQEVIYVVGCLCHRLLQGVVGVGVVPHQLAFLCTQLGDFCYDREGVEVWVGTIGTVDGSLIHSAASLTIGEGCEDRLLGGIDDDDAIRSLASTAFRILLALCDVCITQSCQFFLAAHPDHGVVGGGRKEVAPLLLKFGDAIVDFLHALHLLGREHGTGAYKTFVDDFGESLVLALELAVLMVIDILDALEEFLVERDFIF